MSEPCDHERRNREFWNADADDYQAVHAEQLERGKAWGVWSIPESDVGAIGDVCSLDILEYGCGAAHWAIELAREGARVVGLDQSRGQLQHALENVRRANVCVRLVCASGESLPLPDRSFDLVFCDHGAMSFCEPRRSIAEVARVLRTGGRLVFNKATIVHYLCWDQRHDRPGRKLRLPYFGSRVHDSEEGTVDFQIPYGEWIRLFRANDLVVEDLIELQAPADAHSTWNGFDPSWSRKWPGEEIWSVRKT